MRGTAVNQGSSELSLPATVMFAAETLRNEDLYGSFEKLGARKAEESFRLQVDQDA